MRIRQAYVVAPSEEVILVKLRQWPAWRGRTIYSGRVGSIGISFTSPKAGDQFGSKAGIGVWTFVRWEEGDK